MIMRGRDIPVASIPGRLVLVYSSAMKRKARPIGSTASVASSVANWCRSRPVRRCVLFGSRARSAERADSDIDLALWTVQLPAAAERLAWRRELVEVTGLAVQLVFVTADLDPVLGLQIAREGRVLYQDGPDTWTEERLRLWHLYQDSLPFLRASRRSLRRFVEESRGGA